MMHLTRRLTSTRLLLVVVLIIDLAAVGTHEIAAYSRPCAFGPWPIPQCQVLR